MPTPQTPLHNPLGTESRDGSPQIAQPGETPSDVHELSAVRHPSHRSPGFRWGTFKLSSEQLDRFRRAARECYPDEGLSDEEVTEMAYNVIYAVAVIARLARETHDPA